MAEVVKNRIKFLKKGSQKSFLSRVQKILCVTHEEFAKTLGIASRTLSDWKREKFSMTENALEVMKQKTGICPQGVSKLSPYWYVTLGAKKGGQERYKKYGSIGSSEKRLVAWRRWWEREGKYIKRPHIGKSLGVAIPKYSEDLAEFCGIVLGDGGISKYQVVVTLHRFDDRLYSEYVKKLIKKLFSVEAKRYESKHFLADDIVISRIEAVRFLISLGLKQGSKVEKQVDVPEWIKNDKKFQIACLRGLMDTDGCVYVHSYRVNGKKYKYNKLSFSNRSIPLLRFVYETMVSIGMNAKLKIKHYSVRLENEADVSKYLKIVGTKNQKNLIRYRS